MIVRFAVDCGTRVEAKRIFKIGADRRPIVAQGRADIATSAVVICMRLLSMVMTR